VGAVIGAVAISVVGFSSFGWTLGSTAERMAKERAQTAVVDVLAPIGVEKFRHQADATRVQQGLLILRPASDHQKGRLGNDAGERHSELRRFERLPRTAGRPPVEVRTGSERSSSLTTVRLSSEQRRSPAPTGRCVRAV